jgi:hypothetical protein
MIQFLERKHIDTKKWDECISAYPLDIVYGHSWYLDIVSPGWCGLIMGDYDYVMPVTKKSKFGIHYIAQPFFTQQLGVFAKNDKHPLNVAPFINALPTEFKYIDIQLNEGNDVSLFTEHVNFKKTYKLDLSKNYETLKKTYSQNHKRNIKKASKSKFKIVHNINNEKVLSFKKKNSVNQIKKKQINFFRKIMEYTRAMEAGKYYGVLNNSGQLIAGAFFLFCKKRVFYLLVSSNSEGKQSGASFFLVDKFIQDHAGKPLVLDFEGSEIPGIARFFNGFGALPVYYSQLKINKLPGYLKIFKK